MSSGFLDEYEPLFGIIAMMSFERIKRLLRAPVIVVVWATSTCHGERIL
jgi:hypothetical protein